MKINRDISSFKYSVETQVIYWIEVSIEFQDYDINLNIDINNLTETNFQYNLFEFDVLTEKFYKDIKLISNIYYKKNKINLDTRGVGIEKKDLFVFYIDSKSNIEELYVPE